MSKFKIGDIIRGIAPEYTYCIANRNMTKGIVTNVAENGTFTVKILEHIWKDEIDREYTGLRDKYFELVKDEKEKDMKKSDLKNGMIMQMRNGRKYMVLDNFGVGLSGSVNMNSVNEDLKNTDNWDSWDVVKVYKVDGFSPLSSGISELLKPDNESGKLLWERKPIKVKEMTLEEVCKELGYDVKIVKK